MLTDQLIALLERRAQARGITKKALADMAGLHPNSLRHFQAYGSTRGKSDKPWSPTLTVLRKIEQALPANARGKSPATPPAHTIGITHRQNGKAQD